jgi:hypothetical protein
MASIEFVPDLRREGACGTWGAILLGDGGLCAAMRLPVVASDRATINRVLTAIREVMRADVPGIAPIADVAVGGDQVWVFVGIAPGPSVADLLYEATLAPADLALIALDAGRTLVRLHDSGLWHGAFGADTIVATRTGAIRLTEAGLGPALDGLDVRIITRDTADGTATNESPNGTSGSAVAGGDTSKNETRKIVAASNGAARNEAARTGAASVVTDSTSVPERIIGAGDASAVGTATLTDGADVDVSAWADTVRLFAGHLRSNRAEAEADALAACARRADDDGIVAALDNLEAVARTFGGFPDRGGLEAVMTAYAIEDEPEADTILRAIDALFDPTTAPPPPPPPSAARRFRSSLGRGGGSNGASADPTTGASANPKTGASATPKAGVSADPKARRDGDDRPPRIPAQASPDRMASDTARVSDDEAVEVVAAAPPRTPRKTSVIPTRLPRSPGRSPAEQPSGLWAPAKAPTAIPVRPGTVEDVPLRPDNTVRVGRGVPASNGRRPTPARLGRPAWWPRIAVNIGIAVVIVLGVGGYVWWRVDRPLHVTSVSITVQRHVAAACQLDADVVGTVITTGGTGTFTYQWQRSDGTTTSVHTGKVTDPAKPTEVHLPWTFNGSGEETAQVTLVVLTPQRREASTSFEYICNG